MRLINASANALPLGGASVQCVATRHNRKYVGVDISDEYLELARQRINEVQRVLL